MLSTPAPPLTRRQLEGAAQVMCNDTPFSESETPTKAEILEAISAGVRRAFPWSDEIYNAILNGCADGLVEAATKGHSKPVTAWSPKSKVKPKKQPIPVELRWLVWDRDNFTCLMCGSRKHLSIDHIIAESKGGPSTLENFQTLCRSCNSKKGAR